MAEMRGVLTLTEVEAAQGPVAVQAAKSFRTPVVSRMVLLAAPDSHMVLRFSSSCNLYRLQFELASREEDQAEHRAGTEADSATQEVQTAAGKGKGCSTSRRRRVVVLLPTRMEELAAVLGRLSHYMGKVPVLDLDEAQAVATSRRRRNRLVACTESVADGVCVARTREGSGATGATGRGGSGSERRRFRRRAEAAGESRAGQSPAEMHFRHVSSSTIDHVRLCTVLLLIVALPTDPRTSRAKRRRGRGCRSSGDSSGRAGALYIPVGGSFPKESGSLAGCLCLSADVRRERDQSATYLFGYAHDHPSDANVWELVGNLEPCAPLPGVKVLPVDDDVLALRERGPDGGFAGSTVAQVVLVDADPVLA